MGLFFKDLKDDLSESVNNLPDDTNNASEDSDDVMVNTLDDPELAKMAEAFKMEAQEYDMSEDTSSPETDMGNVSDKDETKEDIKNAAENPEYIADETAVITEGLSIKGDLDSLGSIDLFGTVEGNVTCRGKLTVSGSITGSSKANEFFANDAQVDGDIEAKGAVKIGQALWCKLHFLRRPSLYRFRNGQCVLHDPYARYGLSDSFCHFYPVYHICPVCNSSPV